MIGKLIGLNTYLYTFATKQERDKAREELEATHTITEVFINNGFAFEARKNIIL